MPYKRLDNLRIEGAHIKQNSQNALWRNFSGHQTRYKPEGYRFFNVDIFDEDIAKKLIDDGWNLAQWTPEATDDNPNPETQYRLEVKVQFGDYPPKVTMICDGVKTRLDEETIGLLDTSIIETADLDIHPYHWGPMPDGREGIKAYLQVGYFTIANQDPFAAKYADEEAPTEVPF